MKSFPAFAGLALAAGSLWASVPQDFSRYQVILDRKPFGFVAAAPAAPALAARRAPAPPPFIRDYRMCSISETAGGEIRVGLINIKAKPQATYLLGIGQEEDGILVVDADSEKKGALIRQGSEEHWIYIDGSTGAGSSAVGGVSAARRVSGNSLAGATASRPSVTSPRRMSYAERLRKRREALRKREVRPPKLSGNELKQQLQEYQMEVIRKGLPPLPIPLTKEMDEQLVKEGVLPPIEEEQAEPGPSPLFSGGK